MIIITYYALLYLYGVVYDMVGFLELRSISNYASLLVIIAIMIMS